MDMLEYCVLQTLIFINGHGTISLVVPGPNSIGTVDRNLVIISSQAMTMSIGIRKQTTL